MSDTGHFQEFKDELLLYLCVRDQKFMRIQRPLHPMRPALALLSCLMFPAVLCAGRDDIADTPVTAVYDARAAADAHEIASDQAPIAVTLYEPSAVAVPNSSDQKPAIDGIWLVSSQGSALPETGQRPRFRVGVRLYRSGEGVRHSSLDNLIKSIDPSIPVCLVVHGSFVPERTVVSEAVRSRRWLKNGAGDRPFQMIYFRWESDLPVGPLVAFDVAILGQRASWNGFYLADLISRLPPNVQVGAVGHSHGARVISSALHLLGGGAVDGFCNPRLKQDQHRIRAAFVAGAVDHHWLNPGEEFDRALRRSDGIINLTNSRDPALAVYPLRAHGIRRALGRTGLTDRDQDSLGGLSRQLRSIEVGEIIGCSHTWPAWTNEPSVARCFTPWLLGQ